jgi:hypothetical protein
MSMSNLLHTMHFKNNLHQVALGRKVEKPNKLKSYGSKTTKGAKQDGLNRLWSPMPERGALYF